MSYYICLSLYNKNVISSKLGFLALEKNIGVVF